MDSTTAKDMNFSDQSTDCGPSRKPCDEFAERSFGRPADHGARVGDRLYPEMSIRILS